MADMMHLVAGWGFKSSAVQQSFSSCWLQVHQALSVSQMAHAHWTHALLETRAQTPAWAEFVAWAEEQTPGSELLVCEEACIQAIRTQTESARVQQRFGCGSVSEALSLIGVETLMQKWLCAPEYVADTLPVPPKTQLVLPRVVSSDRQATLAIACVTGFAPASPSFETGVIS
ncbi:MAG: cobalamin biosynthesis protein [Comamonas sp.]|uniref:cobalamin biosynthesis protein n=1 Tax=Comamonas sp. TaxID=34028 RepID=UPI002FC6F545